MNNDCLGVQSSRHDNPRQLRQELDARLDEIHTGIRLRLYDPRVEYLETPFYHPDALYLADERYVVTIVKQHRKNLFDVWPELPWLYPEEIRLASAIALSVPEGKGVLPFSPLPYQTSIAGDMKDSLMEPDELELIRGIAESVTAEQLLDRLPYRLRDANHDGEGVQHDIYSGIDLEDELLIRGLSCLLKSNDLMRHRTFGEEAFMNVQIAREAAMEMIREGLEENSTTIPTFSDAHDYLRAYFPLGEPLADYFEDQHEQWVLTRHPKSRYGIYWTPPLAADDFYNTYEALVSVYRHLILGEPGRATADLG